MEALTHSFFLVFAGEMGDKTQLLALVLVSRFRRPWTILTGIFVATLLNHALASYAGHWLAQLVSASTLRWTLAATFFVFAAWILVPDKDGDSGPNGRFGPFVTTVALFFLAEMGDKTQLATVALGALYPLAWLVTLGTTAGMMAANALAVFLGQKLLARVPMKWVRACASLLFLVCGVGILL